MDSGQTPFPTLLFLSHNTHTHTHTHRGAGEPGLRAHLKPCTAPI